MRRRVGSSVLLLAGGCTLAAVVFELGVRWLEPQPETHYRFSPDTWYEPTPGARFVYRRQEFSVPVRFNDFGMRDLPRRLDKPPGSVRVALLGDSFAEALQVPQDSMLSILLERQVRARCPARAAEVLNFGVSGFGAAAVAARYRALARRFQPDLVLYLFVANDVTDMLGNDARLYEVRGDDLVLHRIELGPVRRLLRHVVDVAKSHLHGYRFLRYRTLRLEEGSRLQRARERGAAAQTAEILPGELAWQRFAQAVRVLQDLVRADGSGLLLVQATTFGPDMTARLTRLCTAQGIPRVDLVPLLAGAERPVTYAIDGHWRPEGHRLAAASLAPIVCERLGTAEPGAQIRR